VGYDGSTLGVLFHTSSTLYKFPDVPFSVFLDLINAKSPGTYYNKRIKGKY
jgi:hypothetical protein